VDGVLRQVLCEEGPVAHQLTKDYMVVKDHVGIVNTERVKHSSQQHILSQEGCKASTLRVRLIQCNLLDFNQPEQHDQWQCEIHQDEESRWQEVW
jgi:hypothetical protein